MTQIINPENKTLEVADILRHHLNDYKAEYPLWPEHRKIVSDLLNCRTARLGGHIERCDNCGAVRITLPQMPAYATRKVAGKTKKRDFAGQLLPCRFHPTA